MINDISQSVYLSSIAASLERIAKSLEIIAAQGAVSIPSVFSGTAVGEGVLSRTPADEYVTVRMLNELANAIGVQYNEVDE